MITCVLEKLMKTQYLTDIPFLNLLLFQYSYFSRLSHASNYTNLRG